MSEGKILIVDDEQIVHESIIDVLEDEGYENLRVLDDGTIIGTGKLIFTTPLYVDLSRSGWGERYCYQIEELALQALGSMQSGEDEPLSGFVATRTGRPL